jgi:hypothetical protein
MHIPYRLKALIPRFVTEDLACYQQGSFDEGEVELTIAWPAHLFDPKTDERPDQVIRLQSLTWLRYAFVVRFVGGPWPFDEWEIMYALDDR